MNKKNKQRVIWHLANAPTSASRLLEEKDIKESMSLRDDLFLDSLDYIEVILAIEKSFDISISDEDMEDTINGTVADVIKLIESKLADK